MSTGPRFEVRRQDIRSDCEHENPKFCKAKAERGGVDLVHYIPAWHVWDNRINDYARGTGPGEFPRAREAREFLTALDEDLVDTG